MEGMFDDLIPTDNKKTISFDDLIPTDNKGSSERIEARANVRDTRDYMSQFMPGSLANQYLPDVVQKFTGLDVTGPIIDKALGAYHSYAMGAARGLPVVGSYLDEAAAGIQSLTGIDYDTALNNARASQDVTEESYPNLSTAGQLVGGIAGGLGLGSNIISKGAPAAFNLARGVVASGTVGAAHEFGAAEGDINDRIEKAESGAKWGVGLGIAAPTLGSVVTPVARLAKKISPTRFKQSFADDELLRALDADGLTPREAHKQYVNGQRNRRLHSNSYAESPVALVDAGDNMRRLGRTITTSPGPANRIASEFVNTRQIKQNDRINDTLERGLRQKSVDGFFKSKDELIKQQRELSEPAYKAAYANAKSVDVDDLLVVWADRSNLTSGAIGQKMKKAIKDVARVSEMNSPDRALKVLNGAKQGLDDMVARSRLKSPNLARELTRMKHELLARVDKTNPDYKKARRIYSNTAELIDAQNMGRLFSKGDPEMNVRAFKSLSQSEQEMFRKGVIIELKKKMGSQRFTHDRTKFFDYPNVREVLKTVFQKDTEKFKPYQQFIELMETESKFVQTRNKIIGGSPTSPRLSEAKEYNARSVGNAAEQLKSGEWVKAVLGKIATSASKLYEFRAQDAEAIAKVLFNDDPKVVSRTLLRLHRKYGHQKTQKVIDEIGEQWGKYGIAGQAMTRD